MGVQEPLFDIKNADGRSSNGTPTPEVIVSGSSDPIGSTNPLHPSSHSHSRTKLSRSEQLYQLIRIRRVAYAALIGSIVLSILAMVLIVTVLLWTEAYPSIWLVGNITGEVNATLGSLGFAKLYPELQVKVKVQL